jgi:hypothetical protein
MGTRFNKALNSFLAFGLASVFSLAASPISMAAENCIDGFQLSGTYCEKSFTYSEGASDFKVPAGLGTVQFEVFGASGGLGGLDCGAGCTAALSSNVGHLVLSFSNLSGKTINIYPGGKGADGATGVSKSGGGLGGESTFSANLNGGRGGDTGPTGTSGAGGGGGAATVIEINGKQYVAAGAGGGGGSANSRNGSTSGNTEAYHVDTTTGGNGLSSSCQVFCDGAGGGGGGAGVKGGAGGKLYQAPNGDRESAGYGGSAGTNTPASKEVTTSNYVEANGSGKVIVRYKPVEGAQGIQVIGSNPTSSSSISFELTLKSYRTLNADDIKLSGTATEDNTFKKTITKKPTNSSYTYSFTVEPTDKNATVNGTLIATVFDTSSAPVVIDQSSPVATIAIQDRTVKAASHVFDVRFDEEAQGLTARSFKPGSGTGKNCKIGSVIGSGKYYQVSLDNCTDGTYGLVLLKNSYSDAVGNRGPEADLATDLLDKTGAETIAQVTPGQIPDQFLKDPVPSVFGALDKATQDALEAAGIYAPMAGAPTVNLVTDLTQATVADQIAHTSNQEVEVGSSIDLGLTVSPEIAAASDVVAFIQTGNLWQYLGRSSFKGTTVSADAFGIAAQGEYKIRLVLVGKDVVTNMSFKHSFGKSAATRWSRAVTNDQTNLSAQQIDITINAVPGANGIPAVVDEITSPTDSPLGNLLDFALPTLNVGEPVANPAIGASGDDQAPSVPFDPLGSPAAVAAVAQTTTTAVAIVSTVAAAAAAAGAAAAASGAAGSAGSSSGGGASSRTAPASSSSAGGAPSSASSESSEQNTDTSNGSISTLDAEVESFTATHVAWGDRIPVFKLGVFTFLDKFTHNLTVRLAKFSPILSKVVNDGAYLRAIFGSAWLAFPVAGIALATIALSEPSVELSPPSWQIFIAIAVLGIFDAFAGMLATLIFAIGMINSYGIQSSADIRMMLGVLLLGFGPALIAVAFRQIRKHFETNFGYFWERLVDLAVLVFFTGWTVSSMVSTLPALAGKTLQAANHVADFGFYLSIAIAIRIVFEEIAARGYSSRLDKINPTEVPSTSQLQKYLSTGLRLGMFIFVTAAFMGNTWQVWVGSIIFILPNVLGWFSDKLPNSAVIWKLIPTGLPGLAFSLVVAGYTSTFISGWLGKNPDYSQWSFMLMPIPMFLVGVVGLFGREGKEDEVRPLKKPGLRWIYRVGGIVVLGLTMKLAGVI